MYIKGRVQGVSFRAAARAHAQSLGVGGYAKNLPGGEVEVLAEGEAAAVDAFVAWCHQGPGLASVQEVSLTEEEVPFGEYDHFAIRY
ncbi:acylphosphatase [Methylogaea oryzae]|uniref:Acylphosphatase n=1 Tax=Methylogaea oryzae TaxID=1295382 RepID=A0A8D4VR42_9GAMM|nr:acylphosphatase [Methylogaea oryzae]BBL72276.1 acylphosphatase [Methylogaea oryzae]